MIEKDKDFPQDRGHLVYVDEVGKDRCVLVPQYSSAENYSIDEFKQYVSYAISDDFKGEISLMRCEGIDRYFVRRVKLS